MYCKYCGEQLPDGSVFCPACGNQLDSTYVGAPLKSKVSSSEVSPSGGPRFVKSTDPVRTQTEVGGYTYTKSSGTNWLPICLGIIIIIIIGFAVLIAAVALVFFPLVTQYSEPHLLDTREFALRADNGTIN
ncbi:MAG: zinc ribbon domain-containing protein, partial [Candidatus Hodarchaeota archaeon]